VEGDLEFEMSRESETISVAVHTQYSGSKKKLGETGSENGKCVLCDVQ
jgi:hypothetical protein